jgi:hypothetical protein
MIAQARLIERLQSTELRVGRGLAGFGLRDVQATVHETVTKLDGSINVPFDA